MERATEFSYAAFFLFATRKPHNEPYNYTDNVDCPLAQFFRSVYPGKSIYVVPDYVRINEVPHVYPDFINRLLVGGGTWGEIVARMQLVADVMHGQHDPEFSLYA